MLVMILGHIGKSRPVFNYQFRVEYLRQPVAHDLA